MKDQAGLTSRFQSRFQSTVRPRGALEVDSRGQRAQRHPDPEDDGVLSFVVVVVVIIAAVGNA